MSLRKDFQEFLSRGNVVDLAIGVIIGGAFGKIVTAFVDDLVMPLTNALLAKTGKGWREFTVTPLEFRVGHFLGQLVDFVIIGGVIFLVLVKFMGMLRKKEPAPAAPSTKTCGECLESIAAAARRCKYCTSAVGALLLLLGPALALAQEPPKPEFKFETAPAVAPQVAEKKLQAKGGLVNLGGNSSVTTGTLGASGSYKLGQNRVSSEAGLALAKTRVLLGQDGNGNKFVEDSGELVRDEQTTSKLLQAKGRYDRFLTLNNSVYGSAQVLSDEPAGKKIVGGGQVGYSRQLWKSDAQRLVAELGYDVGYEKASAAGAEGVLVHSARLFVANDLKLSEATGVFAGVEVLTNLNREGAPAAGYAEVAPLDDTRIFGKAGLTTTLWKNVGFAFSFGLRYDTAPAPLKEPKGVKFWNGDTAATMDEALKAKPAFRPFSKKLDTITEATLVVTFL